MTRSPRLAAPLLLLAAAAACASTPRKPYDPFRVPREEVRAARVIAVAPVSAPSDLADADPVKARYDALVRTALEKAGFSPVPAPELAALAAEKIEEVGGTYDAKTGQLDKSKVFAVNAALGQAMHERHQADAFVLPRISVVPARVISDHAGWDGVTESASAEGALAHFFKQYSGAVPALSFVVWLTSADGKELYANAGGIQLAYKISVKGELVRVEREKLFTLPDRDARAVGLAMDPLAAGVAAR